MLESFIRLFTVGLLRLLLGAHAEWRGCAPSASARVYFANHSSHLDGFAFYASMPAAVRNNLRGVAAEDYWLATAWRRFLVTRCFISVLVDRKGNSRDPLAPLVQAVREGRSLIFFPEGTRGKEALPGPFKSGLHHLAKRLPDVDFIPVYLDNLHRSLPKGGCLPLPMLCVPRIGAPLRRFEGEGKAEFLERARRAVAELSLAAALG